MAYATVRGTLNAGALATVVPASGTLGCAVLVPGVVPAGSAYSSFYDVIAFLSIDAGATQVQLPNVAGILLVDLPNGVSTPLSEIAAAVTAGTPAVAPTGIGPQPTDVAAYASVLSILSSNSLVTVTPVAGTLGCLVLVPSVPAGNYNSYYTVLAYIGAGAGATQIQTPKPAGILLVSLPNGICTPSTEIVAAITAFGSGGPPTGVGGTHT
jgi:hypothetical protein